MSYYADAIMLFPVSFHICYPYFVASIANHLLVKMRIISATADQPSNSPHKLGSLYKVVWTRVRIDFRVAPIAAVLLLLATTAINGSVVRDGIVGTDGVHPLDIMALFISLVRIYTADLMDRLTSHIGIFVNFFGHDRPTALPRLQGCPQRWRFWQKTSLLSLHILPCCFSHSRKCKCR
jgi:hypothetical protein